MFHPPGALLPGYHPAAQLNQFFWTPSVVHYRGHCFKIFLVPPSDPVYSFLGSLGNPSGPLTLPYKPHDAAPCLESPSLVFHVRNRPNPLLPYMVTLPLNFPESHHVSLIKPSLPRSTFVV